ncbi:ATP-binding protein [Pseudoduganella sp. UC29_106]|uniref:hybrid sensor histidine kinase/response regulator n=1 Tax=Pseudoduganella sp. UC29_106 TaxID=3374553 RepID=UPI003756A4CA
MDNANKRQADSNKGQADLPAASTLRALEELHAHEIARMQQAIQRLQSRRLVETEINKDQLAYLSRQIEELREANEHLLIATLNANEMQSAAESVSRRHAEFLSILAHELRGPMQPIQLATTMLNNIHSLHPDLERIGGVIGRQLATLDRLVADLLDAARINTGKIRLQVAAVRLQDVLDAAVEITTPQFFARNQQLTLNPLPEGELVGDAVRLSQIFSNLLSNASKFTQQGGTVVVSAFASDCTVQVTVADNGIGVAKEHQLDIFDMFTQCGQPEEQARRGLGIGLSLVKSICEMHGGAITMNSAGTGAGSEFMVTLPFKAKLADQPFAPPNVAMNTVIPRKILLIEDNEDANECMALLLRQEGHSVTTCTDGTSGVRAAQDAQFDVVISDVNLPGMSGHEVVRELRRILFDHLPCFIATSGYNADRSTAKSFDFYLVKPTSMVQLLDIIGNCVLPA